MPLYIGRICATDDSEITDHGIIITTTDDCELTEHGLIATTDDSIHTTDYNKVTNEQSITMTDHDKCLC